MLTERDSKIVQPLPAQIKCHECDLEGIQNWPVEVNVTSRKLAVTQHLGVGELSNFPEKNVTTIQFNVNSNLFNVTSLELGLVGGG